MRIRPLYSLRRRPAAARPVLAVACCLALLLPGCRRPASYPAVPAAAETEPVPSGTDAADDIAIWTNPDSPADSLVVGTDKDAGILLYDLAGNALQFRPDGRMNNVDLRADVPWGEERIIFVAASNRSRDTIACYRLDPEARALQPLGEVAVDVGVYGFCLYREPDEPADAGDGRLFGIVTTKEDGLLQVRLSRGADGLAVGDTVARIPFAGALEGCVADDANRILWVAEERLGVWKLPASPALPGAPPERSQKLVIPVGAGGPLRADVEGLALYAWDSAQGYLIVSSQGDSSFAVYTRYQPHDYVGSFRIGGGAIDPVSGSDGIEVTPYAYGEAYPRGLLIAQDDANDKGHQNFKFVSFADIATALDLDLPQTQPLPPPPPPQPSQPAADTADTAVPAP